MKMDETKLNAAIKSHNIARVYFLYGKEIFLIKTYANRIIDKLLGKDDIDFNLVKSEGVPNVGWLSDAVDGLPVFAEKKVVFLNDFDVEKTDVETLNRIIEILSDIPKSTVVIINITGFEVDIKKAKTKKLLTCVEKYGVSCEFKPMQPSKIAELIIKKASRAGVIISRENAVYLSELTLRNLTLISTETDKLCAFAGKGGEISTDDIKALIPRQLDSNIFELATSLTQGKAEESFNLLNDLLYEAYSPVVILASLSGTFVDFYRIKLGKSAGIGNDKIAEDFNYAKNRVWLIGKTAPAVNKMSMDYIRFCLEVLSEADYKLKSSPIDNRVILEQVMVKIMGANRKK